MLTLASTPPRKRRIVPRVAALCVAFLTAYYAEQNVAGAQNMPGQPPPTVSYLAPDGTFAMKMPAWWQSRDFAEQKTVEFRIAGPGAAWLQVHRLPLPTGAHPKQLMLRARESRLTKLPHFVEMGRREFKINNMPAASILGVFWYQGNAQYPRAVEEVFVVTDTEGFEFHFECFEPAAQMMAGDLQSVYASFVAHPPPQSSHPKQADEDQHSPYDDISF